jgi:putative Holliday junction resolvase
VGQTITGSATPLTTLNASNGRIADAPIKQLVDQWQPDLLIVGLPLNMDGTESPMSQRARKFARQMARLTHLPVEMVDERLSSVAAAERQRATGRSPRSVDSHAEAAGIIADSYLQQRK